MRITESTIRRNTYFGAILLGGEPEIPGVSPAHGSGMSRHHARRGECRQRPWRAYPGRRRPRSFASGMTSSETRSGTCGGGPTSTRSSAAAYDERRPAPAVPGTARLSSLIVKGRARVSNRQRGIIHPRVHPAPTGTGPLTQPRLGLLPLHDERVVISRFPQLGQPLRVHHDLGWQRPIREQGLAHPGSRSPCSPSRTSTARCEPAAKGSASRGEQGLRRGRLGPRHSADRVHGPRRNRSARRLGAERREVADRWS